MDIKDCPKFIVSDRDGIYGEWLGRFLKDCYDITLCRTPPGMPNCNAFIERWNRPHQSLEQDSPCTKHGKIDFDRTTIRRERLVDGLIVDYSIAA